MKYSINWLDKKIIMICCVIATIFLQASVYGGELLTIENKLLYEECNVTISTCQIPKGDSSCEPIANKGLGAPRVITIAGDNYKGHIHTWDKSSITADYHGIEIYHKIEIKDCGRQDYYKIFWNGLPDKITCEAGKCSHDG